VGQYAGQSTKNLRKKDLIIENLHSKQNSLKQRIEEGRKAEPPAQEVRLSGDDLEKLLKQVIDYSKQGYEVTYAKLARVKALPHDDYIPSVIMTKRTKDIGPTGPATPPPSHGRPTH